MAASSRELVCLFDVDDTLLDNDAFETDLREEIASRMDPAAVDRYFMFFESLRDELGYADFIGALQRLRLEDPARPELMELSGFLMDYPFERRLYPGALDAIAAVRQRVGVEAVIVSDGDIVYQPRKIRRSGLWEAVGGKVLIYIHKEQMLDDIERRFPARRYALADDRLRILAAVKGGWGDRVRTVFVRQGRHANDPQETEGYPAADHAIDAIAAFPDLLDALTR